MRNIAAASGKSVFIAVVALLFTMSVSAQVSLRRAMDTDNDSKADFTVFRPSNNTWYISKSGGGVTFTTFGIANEDYMAPGDFDGDGKGDISVWRDTTGVWYRLNSSNNAFVANGFGITGDEPIARDYDGDGKTDLAVVRRTGGAMIWYVLRSLDGGFVAYQFGLSTDFTAPGDYDGDLKFDYAVQRPGATPNDQGTFYISATTAGFSVVGWGLSNDLVVPGDYDGDLKTDIAVVREGTTPTSNLVWYVRRSSDLGLYATSFGLTGSDLNVQNDYDGDGKTDVAVWRNTDGNFYVQTSTNIFNTLVYHWGNPNDFPVASYDSH
jgi:hypothetical protein